MVEFLKKDTCIYQRAAKKYLPNIINYLFILESPPYPKNGTLLFFFLTSTPSKYDTLFKLFIRSLYDRKYGKNDDKDRLLNKFKNDGYFLIDVVEYPINKDINGNNLEDDENTRKIEIRKNKQNLLDRLNELKDKNIITKNTKVIIIKKNVFEELYIFLKKEGFNIMNNEKINY
ncbi:unnamed protein product, partial [marine sediment metagenome]